MLRQVNKLFKFPGAICRCLRTCAYIHNTTYTSAFNTVHWVWNKGIPEVRKWRIKCLYFMYTDMLLSKLKSCWTINRRAKCEDYVSEINFIWFTETAFYTVLSHASVSSASLYMSVVCEFKVYTINFSSSFATECTEFEDEINQTKFPNSAYIQSWLLK